jgi:alanyl-tRNA synthetase
MGITGRTLEIDLTTDGDTRGALVNQNDPRCIEIWNLVFIQFNANPDGTFAPLPQRHVDTGMGFERVTAIIQGTKNLTDFSGTISNYDTDIFRPIFDELEKLSGKKYGSTIPIVGQAHRLPVEEGSRSGRPTIDSEQEKIDVAFRVIADHIRALSFAIADGIIPSNEGRGYVLRRVLRRAVRYGRTLGFHEPFFFKLVDVVARTMGDVFPELRAKQLQTEKTIRREEEAFNKTLDEGIARFDAVMRFKAEQAKQGIPVEEKITAQFAFQLYDTYGFPLDLTELMARERGLTVDVAGFEKLMEEQRERARKAQKKSLVEILDQYDTPTKFVGYDHVESAATLLGIIADSTRTQFAVFDISPFYAEMGGQVGDQGEALLEGRTFQIKNTIKRGNTFLHELEVPDLPTFTNFGGEAASLKVDIARRRAIERHHTVTHLLHWALHEVVSRDASQKGSYVGSDKLTFDFSSAPLTPEQKRDVEKLVNEKIGENAPVSWTEIPYAEVKQRKDIIQFFGEKYGDTVRVLQIGGAPRALNGYSMELCGGTHVIATGEIGPFRILKEEAIAAGTRRIEAVAGDAARAWAKEEAARQQKKFETLARKKPDIAPLPAFQDDAATAEMLKQIDARTAQLEKVDADVREWEKKTAKTAEAQLRSRAAQIANELARSHAGKDFCVAEVPDADAKLLQAVADTLKPKFSGPIFLIGAANGSVALVASVPKDLTSKLQANKLIEQIAPIVGGKGGGRPDNARGAGKDASKIAEALEHARALIAS